MLRVIVLLAVLCGVAWYFDKIPDSLRQFAGSATQQAASVAPAAAPQVLYRWKDAKGGVVYGSAVPAGVKAERVSGERGSISTVQATKVPPPEASKPGEQGMSLQQQAIERAIERSN